jgi:hypothetical protein
VAGSTSSIHGVADDPPARAVRGQRRRRDHPDRKSGGEGGELPLVRLEADGRGPLLGGEAVEVRVIGRLEDLERASVAQTVDVGLAALADGLPGIEPHPLALEEDVHGHASLRGRTATTVVSSGRSPPRGPRLTTASRRRTWSGFLK